MQVLARRRIRLEQAEAKVNTIWHIFDYSYFKPQNGLDTKPHAGLSEEEAKTRASGSKGKSRQASVEQC